MWRVKALPSEPVPPVIRKLLFIVKINLDNFFKLDKIPNSEFPMKYILNKGIVFYNNYNTPEEAENAVKEIYLYYI